MDKPKIDALAERVERMERENRRWRCGAGLGLIAGLVVIIGGAQRVNEAKVVEAEQFIIRDKDGKERARLGITSEGGPALFIRGKDGQARAMLQTNEENVGGLYLRGSDGRLSVVLGAASRASNTPDLILMRHDKQRINLNVNTIPGQPWLSIRDESGKLLKVPEPLAKPLATSTVTKRPQ